MLDEAENSAHLSTRVVFHDQIRAIVDSSRLRAPLSTEHKHPTNGYKWSRAL